METKVRCPGCQTVLQVPRTAAGQVARCPSCQTKFKVPSQQGTVDDQVSAWIDQDLDDLQTVKEEQWERRAAEATRHKEDQARVLRERNVEKIEKYFGSRQGSARGTSSTTQASRPATPGTRLPQHTPSHLSAAPGSARPARPDSPLAPAPTEVAAQGNSSPEPIELVGEAPPDVPPEAPPEAPPTQAEAPSADANKTESRNYPTELSADPGQPHLVIDNCSQEGVMFVFDSNCLKHQGFRMAMPIGCAFSNDRTRGDLVARPLAFYDQSQGAVRNAQEVEAGHEQHLPEDQSTEALLAALGRLEHLPPPFNLPLPYYVNTEHANAGMSIECHTDRRMTDGGFSCSVLIPHGSYALQWLGNVNGTCGREYQMLAHDVATLWSEAWEGVSEQQRQRLGKWADFEPGENFRYYVNDAEFGEKDEGMAGIVLTDRRLIYHKYHRHGAVQFSDAPKLILAPDGDFAALTIKTGKGRVKAGQIRLVDLDPLVEALRAVNLDLELVSL